MVSSTIQQPSFSLLLNDRYDDTGATQPLHGGYQGQGHKTGDAGEAVLVLERSALSCQQ